MTSDVEVMSDTILEVGIIFFTQKREGIIETPCFCVFLAWLCSLDKRWDPQTWSSTNWSLPITEFCPRDPSDNGRFGVEGFPGDAEYQLVLYHQWVDKGLSLDTDYLLGDSQTRKLCMRISWCRKLIRRYPRYVGVCGLYWWILKLLVNNYIPIRETGPRSNHKY